MDENQFWVNFWRTAAIALVAIVSVIAGCTANNTVAIKQMVADGANPIDAMCALNGYSNNPQCLARAIDK